MQLSQAQLAQFDRDGFLRFDSLFNDDEVAAMKAGIGRIGNVASDAIYRERNGSLRTIFRAHDPKCETYSPVMERLTRTPRLLGPAKQVLRDDEVYVYHTKSNIKTAVDGTVWLWHQDYGYWQNDGVPTDNMVTSLVMLDEATEMGGCLYFVPGSHKRGVLPAFLDETTTSYGQRTIEKEPLREFLRANPNAIPIAGPPGTSVLFHCNIVHSSGHNLSPNDRWHMYVAYNPCKNRPNPIPEKPRAEWVVSTDYAPLRMLEDDSILEPVHA